MAWRPHLRSDLEGGKEPALPQLPGRWRAWWKTQQAQKLGQPGCKAGGGVDGEGEPGGIPSIQSLIYSPNAPEDLLERPMRTASLASGRAGVKASCSHVRTPYDRATHPTSLLPGLSQHSPFGPASLSAAPPGQGPASLSPPQGRKTGGEARAQTSGPSPAPHARQVPGPPAPAACPEATQPPQQVSPHPAVPGLGSPPQSPGTPSHLSAPWKPGNCRSCVGI